MDIARLSIKQLRAFVAVYRLGRLAAAAEQLSVTQSAVSVLVRQIEGALEVRLFDRSARALVPTRAADEIVGLAERILRDLGQLSASARELATLRRGRVHVAVTPGVGMAVMPAAVRRFVQQHPEVSVLLDDCAPDQFLTRVLSEAVEFGVGTPERLGADIDARPLLKDQLCLVLDAAHPLAARARVRWADLGALPLILLKSGYGVRRTIDAVAAQAGVALNVVNDINFLHSALWMAASGLGATVLPSKLAAQSTHANLVARPLVGPRVDRSIYVVTRRGRTLSPASRRFVELLRECNRG